MNDNPQIPNSNPNQVPGQYRNPDPYANRYPIWQEPDENMIRWTQAVYILHGISIIIGVFSGASIATAFVFGWPSIIAVIINYVKKSDVQGTYLATHFTWQIRTFWYAFLWILVVLLIGFVLSIFLIGFAIWLVGFIILGVWVCYRIIRGWLRLSDNMPMPL